MWIKKARPGNDIPESDVTDERIYKKRRQFMKKGLYAGAALSLSNYYSALAQQSLSSPLLSLSQRISMSERTEDAGEELNSFSDITSYNNFYELGTAKSDPSRNADKFVETDPWSIEIGGECDLPGTYTLEDILAQVTIEERVYRLRCVEGWSMVIPWNGFQLSDMLARFRPNSRAKYVYFETYYDPQEPLLGQTNPILRWPYREGLRMDEAMNPLTFMAVGLYGNILPNQNGAPIRLVVPWKYGFKSIKSVVKIHFVEMEPETSWNLYAPEEYGFYSNVNPNVNHPRWSQAQERRIGEFFRRDTLMFNGYAEQVAHMYQDMDLEEYF